MRQSDVRTPQCRELASFYDAARLVPATCIVVAGMAAQASFLVLSPVPFTVSVFHRTACYLPPGMLCSQAPSQRSCSHACTLSKPMMRFVTCSSSTIHGSRHELRTVRCRPQRSDVHARLVRALALRSLLLYKQNHVHAAASLSLDGRLDRPLPIDLLGGAAGAGMRTYILVAFQLFR